jgi:signal transduction histidine kinase
METLLQTTSLVKRAYWLVRLRWIAIAGLVIAVFVATEILIVKLPVSKLYFFAGILAFYNFLLFDLLRYFTWGDKEPSRKTISRIITLQISLDLLILTTILHFSGGIENPFFFFFVFHMIIASILLSQLQSYLQAILAVFLFGGLAFLEFSGKMPHYHLEGFIAEGLYRNGMFVFGTVFIFSATLFLVVYMTNSISLQLQKQQESYEQANAQLLEHDRFKNEYVLRLTHDIRGHIAAIQSCIGIVDSRMVGPLNEKQEDLVHRSYRRASKCMAFITSLLKLTRMKLTGQLEMGYFSLKKSVFNAITAVQDRVVKKAIDVNYDIDTSVDEIYGEPVLIEEALGNLLFNAARYTPGGGSITLNVKDAGSEVLIEVIDTGIGISEDDINRIFEEFYRAENARKMERDGTGLGLSIARQVVERHGGRMWAQNNLTVGSTFSMVLPKHPPEPEETQL